MPHTHALLCVLALALLSAARADPTFAALQGAEHASFDGFGRSLQQSAGEFDGASDADREPVLEQCKELKADDAATCFFRYAGVCYSPKYFGVAAGEYCSAHAVVSLGALGSVTVGQKDAPYCACANSPWYACRAAVEGEISGSGVRFFLGKCALAWWAYGVGALAMLIFGVGVWAIVRWACNSRPSRRQPNTGGVAMYNMKV